MQSSCKPINYCMALEALGEEEVHRHVGREPSGRSFNELALNHRYLPHNPMINAGAIMACSLIGRDKDLADRFDGVMRTWRALAGGDRPGYNNAVYLSEKATADRNFALAYFMRENEAFPDDTDILEVLDFYFQCCSIEMSTERMAVVAGTLASGGVCPTTGERVFSNDTVKDCLSLMYSCGMYDFSGEFAFSVGIPAKSGVSGVLMVVIPEVMGLAIWSPRLDKHGNSVRGVEFCKRLVKRFAFHNYDNIAERSDRIDPRRPREREETDYTFHLIRAASQGDVNEISRLTAFGVDLGSADYDGRTALHLAASEGRADVVEFLLSRGVDPRPRDRWGHTPHDDAERHKHDGIAARLER
ncbi:MAG: glutaminase [Pseudomonadota bacterium]